MSTIFSTAVQAQGMAGQSRVSGLLVAVKHWWVAYLMRRIERAAIAQLGSMSDRDLKDIGLTRSQVTYAVTGAPSDYPFRRCY